MKSTTPSVADLQVQYHQIIDNLPKNDNTTNAANCSLLEILQTNNASKEFADAIENEPQLAALLKDEKQEFTVFAPPTIETPSQDALSMHISPHFLGITSLAEFINIPVILRPESLGGKMLVRRDISLEGITIGHNSSNKIVLPPVRAKNGIIYYIEKPIDLPLDMLTMISRHTELSVIASFFKDNHDLLSISSPQALFAPTNKAWSSLSDDILCFLKSAEGRPYLRAILKAHIVPGYCFTSNIIYPINDSEDRATSTTPPRAVSGRIQLPLSTLLKSDITAQITRYHGLVALEIGGFPVTLPDIMATNGSIQGIDGILLPIWSTVDELKTNLAASF